MNFDRRQWLLAAAAMMNGTARAVDFDKPPEGTADLTAQQTSGMVLFRWNNRPLATYRAHSSQKYPYFYPLAGPASGVSLVAESALPYPHHRGLWLGCEPLNGGDYWGDTALSRGQVRSAGPQLGKSAPRSGRFTDRTEWVRDAAPSPVEDSRNFTLTVGSNKLWWLDADIVLSAREDFTIKSAKHSFFALRVIPELAPLFGGSLLNSEGGAGAAETYGKPARWCGYYGKTTRDIVEGLVVMEHPENPWAPCPWFTRDYGHLSPSPFAFLKEPWTLAKGKSIRMRYRVAMHTGTPREAGIDDLYRAWIA